MRVDQIQRERMKEEVEDLKSKLLALTKASAHLTHAATTAAVEDFSFPSSYNLKDIGL